MNVPEDHAPVTANAPDPAWGRGAVAVAARWVGLPVCLAQLGRFGSFSRREPARHFIPGAGSGGGDAVLEVARIYFPQ